MIITLTARELTPQFFSQHNHERGSRPDVEFSFAADFAVTPSNMRLIAKPDGRFSLPRPIARVLPEASLAATFHPLLITEVYHHHHYGRNRFSHWATLDRLVVTLCFIFLICREKHQPLTRNEKL
jgi:hypothetical protein